MRIKRKWIAGIIILLIYFCTYQGSEGLRFRDRLDRLPLHIINFVLLAGVAATGAFGVALENQKWVQTLWIFLYIVFITAVSVLGILDLILHFQNESFRHFLGFLRLFFTSPVPYGIMLFLSKNMERKSKEFKR